MANTKQIPNPQWLSAQQFASRLSWHPSYTSVWRWMNEGKVKSKRVTLGKNNVRRIPVEEVARIEELFASGATEETTLTEQADTK